ncbi:MAG: aldo/keto reductase [Bryobacteraceae bacterium]
MSISRREFLEGTLLTGLTAGCVVAEEGSTLLPARILGKTGVRVSILGMGAGRFLLYKEEDKAIEAVRKGLDLGINYIDTADAYGRNHLSEVRVGKAIQGRRDGIFLATKLSNRNGAESQRVIEESLKALQVSQVDLIHIHELTNEEDLTAIEAKGGALEQVLKLRDQKITRFIGITSHADPRVFKTAIERHDFDCAQMTLNAGMVGMTSGSRKGGLVPDGAPNGSFEELALPVAVRKNMGILAIKVYAQEHLIGQASTGKLLYYALSLPIASAVVGMPKLEHIDENVRLAKAFKPLPPAEMKDLSTRLSAKNKIALERFFSTHVDS